MNVTVGTADTVFDIANVLVMCFGCAGQIIFCLALSLCVLCQAKNPFNALCASRFVMILFVIFMNLGVIIGNTQTFEQLAILGESSVIPSQEPALKETFRWFCRTYYISNTTSLTCIMAIVALMLFFNFRFKEEGLVFKEKPFEVKSVPCTNLMVLGPSLGLTLIVFLVGVFVFFLEYIVLWAESTPSSAAEVFWKAYMDDERSTCHYPIISFIVLVIVSVAFFVFFIWGSCKTRARSLSEKFKRRLLCQAVTVCVLLIAALSSRTLEMLFYAIPNLAGNFAVDRVARLLAMGADLALVYVILICYVVIPMIDTIDSVRWNKNVHSDEKSYGYGTYEARMRQRTNSFMVDASGKKIAKTASKDGSKVNRVRGVGLLAGGEPKKAGSAGDVRKRRKDLQKRFAGARTGAEGEGKGDVEMDEKRSSRHVKASGSIVAGGEVMPEVGYDLDNIEEMDFDEEEEEDDEEEEEGDDE